MAAKCPNSKGDLPYINGEPIEIKPAVYSKLSKGVVHSCPGCSFVLSVQLNPVALQNWTVAETVRMAEEG